MPRSLVGAGTGHNAVRRELWTAGGAVENARATD
jgi:hypothetical protein